MNTVFCRFFLTFVALVPAAACANEPASFGRLFSSPAQRQALDQLREKNATDGSSTQTAGSDEPSLKRKETNARTLKIQGVISRGNGSSVMWVDDRRWDSLNQTHSGFSLITAPDTPVQIMFQKPGQGELIRLKPGQTLLLDSGIITELFDNESLPTGPVATPGNKP